MKIFLTRRPRLSLPYTILTAPDTVRLVAGEDSRYTLTGPGVETWFPGLLANLDGRRSLHEILPLLSANDREPALKLIERLYGERILSEGPVMAAHPAQPYLLAITGTGKLASCLPRATDSTLPCLSLLCQDRLDYDEALHFNRRCLSGVTPWLWATSGPMERGFVSPIFLPDAGPCLACLIRQFQRLSPAPEIYSHLIDHAQRGQPIEPVPFPDQGIEILKALVCWKAALLSQLDPEAALYRLHVLEVATLEVTAHQVLKDPECPDCGEGK